MDSPEVPRDPDARPAAPPSGGFDASLALASLYDRLNKLEGKTSSPKKGWYDSQLFSTVLGAILDYRRSGSDSPAPFDSAYRLAPYSSAAGIAPDVAIGPDEIRTQLEKVRAFRGRAGTPPPSR